MCYVFRQSPNIGTNSVVQHVTIQVCATFRPNSIDMTHKPDPIKVPQVLAYKTPVVILCTAKFNTQPFSVLPTQCVHVFCVDLRTNNDYFPIHH